jgi:hypothetical protein
VTPPQASEATWRTLGAAALVALGLALAGWWAGAGFAEGRSADRYVTVKGVAEREVRSDLGLWPLRFVAAGEDLMVVQAKLAEDQEAVMRFLSEAGFAPGEVELQHLEVTDRLAQAYRSGPVDTRFIVARTLMVRSGDVERMAEASQRVGALVDAGVVLGSERGPRGGGPYYLFTGLTDIKPEMIAEATANARAAAEQFARDSRARLDGIRRANQGLFQILPRDQAPGITAESQVHKTVRVVSTIDYRLAD